MDSDFFLALLYELHDTDGHTGPSRFCEGCRTRVAALMPVIRSYINVTYEVVFDDK